MKFCSHCGAPLSRAVPAGDHRERHICKGCGAVFYENPKIVVGCILEWRRKLLLCKRAIEPRSGYWTLPAGFMENGESTAEGALRETIEEAGANAVLDGLFTVIDIPAIDQVYLFFRGRLLSDEFNPGHETLQADLFDEHQIPWEALAFSSVRRTLETYFRDRAKGSFSTHTFTLPDHSSKR